MYFPPPLFLLSRRTQVLCPQQKDPAAAHRNLGPNKWQTWESAQQRVFCIADFHDQNAVAAEVPPRRGEYRPHRIKPIAARSEPEPRLVPIFARELGDLRAPDIGRIAHDDIVTAALHRVEII